MTLKSGWKINYWESGSEDAPAILFIHGLSESCEYWMPALNRSEMSRYRCLAIDLLGFGYSDKPKEFDYSMEAQAGTIREFLTRKKIDKVVYVGHSMGGAVGMALLRLHPETINKIVLVDSLFSVQYLQNASIQIPKIPEWLFNFVFPFIMLRAKKIAASVFFEAPTKELLNMGARISKQTTAYSLVRSLKGLNIFLKKPDLLTSFLNSQIPHYYIYGTVDLRVAKMVDDYFANEIWVHAISNVKHCPMVEAPDSFSSILDDILSSIDR